MKTRLIAGTVSLVVASVLCASCSSESGQTQTTPPETPKSTAPPPTVAPRTQEPPTPSPELAETEPAETTQPDLEPVYVLMTTSSGDILLELDAERAPVSVDNFLGYVDSEFYDGTIFHRVMDGFMIQGGGLAPDLTKKPTRDPIRNEWGNGLTNDRGTIAMARTRAPNSATSQFFINVVDNPRLDQPISGGAGYAVFGKVVAGMDVVDEIKAVPTGQKKTHINVPIMDVVIEKARRMSAEEAKKLIEA